MPTNNKPSISFGGLLASAVTEGFALVRAYLEGREEAYKISMDKKKRKALNIAEECFTEVREFIDYVEDKLILTDEESQSIQHRKKIIFNYIRKFNKYD